MCIRDRPTGPFTFLKAGRVNPGKWPLNLDKKDQTTEFTNEMPDYVRIIRRDFPGGQIDVYKRQPSRPLKTASCFTAAMWRTNG